MKFIEPPEGIIITVSKEMLRTGGYRRWLKNFLSCMQCDDCAYCFKSSGQIKHQVQYIYLCIGGRVRFRIVFVESTGASFRRFGDGEVMYAKGWITGAGPIERAPRRIEMHGFQGFRYTEKLF